MKDEEKSNETDPVCVSKISRAKMYVIRDGHGKFILEIRLGRMNRRKGFVKREDALNEGVKIINSGRVSEWINAKRANPRMTTVWSKTHPQVKVVPGWRGRTMIGWYSK